MSPSASLAFVVLRSDLNAAASPVRSSPQVQVRLSAHSPRRQPVDWPPPRSGRPVRRRHDVFSCFHLWGYEVVISRFGAIMMLRDRNATTSCAQTVMKSVLHGVLISECCTATTPSIHEVSMVRNADITILSFLDIVISREDGTSIAYNLPLDKGRFMKQGRAFRAI